MEKFFDLALEAAQEGTEGLYFRSKGFISEYGMLKAERKGSEVAFDTYFNMIPSAKLREYTSAHEIVFTVLGKHIETELFASDGSQSISLGREMKISVSDIPENAVYIYPVVRAADNSAVLERISVSIEGESTSVNIALIICTYKREEYLIPNLEYISREIKLRDLPIEILTVDNAQTISSNDVPAEVWLIPNENTGGSGGFARGMAEAEKSKRFTHFILMDDDVKLDMVSVQKLAGFVRFRNEKHKDVSISGSMLYMDRPVIQFESGGYFSYDGTQTGFGHYLDMCDKKNISVNERSKTLNYGGWWFMCIPMRYVYEGNYPMPFFVKYDDVEYALRCRLEIITLNGVSVWHEPFEWKYNSSSEYYNIRNFLYLRSMTDKHFTKRQAKKIAYKQILEKLCRQQYKMAEAVKLGYRDFLKGIDYLKEINAEENHRKVTALDYEMISEDEIYNRYGIGFSEEKYRQSQNAEYKWYMRPLLYGLLVPKIFCKKDYAVVDAFFDRKEMYFSYTRVLHINMYLKQGYITYKKNREGDK